MDDTIAALATPSGNGGIAIIRISGQNATGILEKIFSFKGSYEHAKMIYGYVDDGGRVLDGGYAVVFYAPRSYTGEDVAELHIHGGQMGVANVLACVFKNGARPAEPGEFSRRAFLNGKMDLTEAEAVCDYISAVSAAGVRAASRQMQGTLKECLINYQDALTDIIAEIEAAVEYPEEDLELEITKNALPAINKLREKIEKLEKSYENGKIIKDGLDVVIAGKPNVGKSSLLNALAGSDRAIVSDVPGTTRDTVEQALLYNGIAINLTDTAGIRSNAKKIESEGVKRSKNALNEADAVLFVLDATRKIDDEDKDAFKCIKNPEDKVIVVLNKIDSSERMLEKDVVGEFKGFKAIEVSAKTGEKVEELKNELYKYAVLENLDEGLIITNARHKDLLARASRSLKDAEEALCEGADMDCVTIDLNEAWSALGAITGNTVTEDIIDRIFDKFCLGK